MVYCLRGTCQKWTQIHHIKISNFFQRIYRIIWYELIGDFKVSSPSSSNEPNSRSNDWIKLMTGLYCTWILYTVYTTSTIYARARASGQQQPCNESLKNNSMVILFRILREFLLGKWLAGCMAVAGSCLMGWYVALAAGILLVSILISIYTTLILKATNLLLIITYTSTFYFYVCGVA